MKKSVFNLFLPFLRLIRWPNLLIVMLTQSLVMFAIINRIYSKAGTTHALELMVFIALVFITVIIAAAGYIINDYFDIRTDRINKPEDVVIGRYLPRRKAIKLHIILNSLAIVAGFIISLRVSSFRLGFIFPVIIMLLWLYSERYKRTVLAGNFSVAFITAMVVLVVWLFEFFALRTQPDKFMAVYTKLGLINNLVFSYSVFAFLLTLAREIIKDAEDVEGDASTGCRTFPVVYGTGHSKNLAALVLVLTLILVLFGCYKLFSISMTLPSIYFGVFVCLPLLFLIIKIGTASSKSDFHKLSTIIKMTMLAGILGMVVLAIYL